MPQKVPRHQETPGNENDKSLIISMLNDNETYNNSHNKLA